MKIVKMNKTNIKNEVELVSKFQIHFTITNTFQRQEPQVFQMKCLISSHFGDHRYLFWFQMINRMTILILFYIIQSINNQCLPLKFLIALELVKFACLKDKQIISQ